MSAIRDKERVFDTSIRKKSIHILRSFEQEVIPAAGNEEGLNLIVDLLGMIQDIRRVLGKKLLTAPPTERSEVAKSIQIVQPYFQCVISAH